MLCNITVQDEEKKNPKLVIGQPYLCIMYCTTKYNHLTRRHIQIHEQWFGGHMLSTISASLELLFLFPLTN